ncbi:hypothetical protein EXS65_04525 [Candidatus Peribacteria bacterium]|nr:hypothetical protein [Candidatus Peribacteria bacterium]
MKKLSFLLGSVGGALAGYVFSNNKLRSEMMKAKDTTAAAKILGSHLAKDGQTVAKEVQQLAEQHHLDQHIAHGKKYVKDYYDTAKDEVQTFLSAKVKDATKAAKFAKKEVVKKAEKTTKKVMKKVKSMTR